MGRGVRCSKCGTETDRPVRICMSEVDPVSEEFRNLGGFSPELARRNICRDCARVMASYLLHKTREGGCGEPAGRPRIDRGKIIALYNAGWNNAKIADEMGCHANTVRMVVNRYLERIGKEKGNGQA